MAEMENKVTEANKRHKTAEEQLEELRQELRDVEGSLQTNQDEMMSLHEQLTEVREREREREQARSSCTYKS